MVNKISEFKIHSLASGSRGNCLLLNGVQTNILIDVGISHKKLCSRLQALNLSLQDIDAVFITHEHKDHVSGLATFMKNCDINVFAKEETWRNMFDWRNLRKNYCQRLPDSILLGDFQIEAFPVSHDAAATVGYNIYQNKIKCSVLTDVGFISSSVRNKITNSDFIVLESNHDLDMLAHSRYPEHLKQRIRSNKGHLSNDDAAWTLSHIIEQKNIKVLLAHLSEENNTGENALETARKVLKQVDKLHRADIKVALPDSIVSI